MKWPFTVKTQPAKQSPTQKAFMERDHEMRTVAQSIYCFRDLQFSAQLGEIKAG